MSEPTLQDCINYMRSQIKQMEKHPRSYEFNLPYYRKTVELLEKAERPHGEWKPHDQYGLTKVWYERYKCSNCNEYGWIYWNFCPNCGADMRKEGETREE